MFMRRSEVSLAMTSVVIFLINLVLINSNFHVPMICVKRKLYISPNFAQFFVHCKLQDFSNCKLGIDTASTSQVIHDPSIIFLHTVKTYVHLPVHTTL